MNDEEGPMPIANEDIDKSLEGNRTILENSHDSNSVIELTNDESENNDLKMTALKESDNDRKAENLIMRTNLHNESTINVKELSTIPNVSSESILHG